MGCFTSLEREVGSLNFCFYKNFRLTGELIDCIIGDVSPYGSTWQNFCRLGFLPQQHQCHFERNAMKRKISWDVFIINLIQFIFSLFTFSFCRSIATMQKDFSAFCEEWALKPDKAVLKVNRKRKTSAYLNALFLGTLFKIKIQRIKSKF